MGCEYRSSLAAEQIDIRGISERTDCIEKGNLFIAVKGARFDPILLLKTIEGAGAAALVAEESEAPLDTVLPCFYVKDVKRVRSLLWSRFYGSPEKDMTIIGITGTNGKTTTAHILTHILSASGKRAGYIGTLGIYDGENELPTYKEGNMTTPSPRTLFRALAALKVRGVTHAVLEVSSHALVQERTFPIVFELAVFTNLGEDHLDYHKTTEAYFCAKALLFQQARRALINIDDGYGERLYGSLEGEKHSYGILQSGDFSATDLHEKRDGSTQYTCLAPYAVFEISYPLFGTFNVYNSLAASAAALLLGLCPHEVYSALLSLTPVKGRLEVLDLTKYRVPFSVIIDYAHTPDAMEQAIKAVRRITRGKLYVLFGAGGEREREKRAKMGRIAEELADHVFVTADNSRAESLKDILKDILDGMTKEEKRSVIADRERAIERALESLSEEDTLLLLGKGHEEYLIGKNGSEPFSEREIVFAYLEKHYGI